MIDTRQIKKVLTALYGKGTVTARMSRGYFARVHVDATPLDREQAREWEAQARAALIAAKCDLGMAFTDDDCRYTMDRVHIGFNAPRFWRTFRSDSGALWGQPGSALDNAEFVLVEAA
jgi:hypothetical protein